LEFRGEVNYEETRVMGLSSSEDRTTVAGVVLTWWYRLWRTGRQTDRQNLSQLVCWCAVKNSWA